MPPRLGFSKIPGLLSAGSIYNYTENLEKSDDTPYFPSKHLQYHLHPKWMQEYPRQGPLRDVENNGFQKELQNYCKQLDVAINQKWYLKNLLEDENKVCIFSSISCL